MAKTLLNMHLFGNVCQVSRRSKPKPRRLNLQVLETRRVMAAELPLGATVNDTAEFLLGRVAVTPIFIESDGSLANNSEDWNAAEVDAMLARIDEGLGWWTDTLDQMSTVHTLEFVVDETYARDPDTLEPTPVIVDQEPITQTSDSYEDYVIEFLNVAGVDRFLQTNDAIRVFNDSQRVKHEADWAFSIFIVDASNDVDGLFQSGGSFRGAFAFPGGRYIVTPSSRPAQTIAHELGHIFWAFDEYSGGESYDQFRGYYNTQNLNAVNNPAPGFVQETSIMAGLASLTDAFRDNISPASTLALVGWQDSDSNGIFDVLDVPLELEGSGSFDAEMSQFRFRGEANAVPLRNLNPLGRQSDITLNKISRLEASIDGGDWFTVIEPGTAVATFDVPVAVPESFSTIAFRVVDDATGIQSNVIVGTGLVPAATASPFYGYAYLDSDEDGIRSAGEPLLPSSQLTLTKADGTPLQGGAVVAASLPRETSISPIDGITLVGGNTISGSLAIRNDVEVRTDASVDDAPLFYIFDSQLNRYTPNLNQRTALQFELAEPTSHIEVDVIGLDFGIGYARVEALSASGEVIDRITTDRRNDGSGSLDLGERQTLSLDDPLADIVAVRVFGQNQSQIGVEGFRYGIVPELSTDDHGSFSVPGLPDGEYRVDAQGTSVTTNFTPQTITVSQGIVANGDAFSLNAVVVDSPRFNTSIPEDVNQDGKVSAVDALQVINDLNSNDARALTWNEIAGSKIDVTNDGMVSALDALRVINRLNSDNTPSSEPLSLPDSGTTSGPSLLSSTESLATPLATKSLATKSLDSDAVDEAMQNYVDDDLGVEKKVVAKNASSSETASYRFV